eukprot:5254554-Pleurochrysis_carterae.AAC.1
MSDEERQQRLRDHFKALDSLVNRLHICGKCKEVGIDHEAVGAGWAPGTSPTQSTFCSYCRQKSKHLCEAN